MNHNYKTRITPVHSTNASTVNTTNTNSNYTSRFHSHSQPSAPSIQPTQPTNIINITNSPNPMYDQLLNSELLLKTPQKSINYYSNYTRLPQDNTHTPHSTPYTILSPYAHSLLSNPNTQQLRQIPKTPYKVLDAPDLQDDFYLNLVDWSSTNILGVGLGSCVYLWSACTSKVTKLCDLGSSDTVTSVSWSPKGSEVAIGTNKGYTQIWDIRKNRKIRQFASHQARVGCTSWNLEILTTGSRDRTILNRDLRSPNDYAQKLSDGHKQEVCGLKWNPEDSILASGGNDNRMLIWDKRQDTPILKCTDHTAAIKALAWSPHENGVLASGGGTADRHITFRNVRNNQIIKTLDTGSQVCNIAYSKNENEIVSTHGYSQNQIIVWKVKTMTALATLTGHSSRVLFLAVSPDGQNVVSGAGDETLRFWNVFSKAKPSGRLLEQSFR